MMNKEIFYWLGFNLFSSFGGDEVKHIIEAFSGDISHAYNASINEIKRIEGVSTLKYKVFLEKKDEDKLKREIEKIKKYDVDIMTYDSSLYPFRLKEIYYPPILLYAKGTYVDILKHNLVIAIVGSRKMTDYGAACTENIARKLVESDVVIISGLAKGIDSVAHKTAVNFGGYTIGVSGCGMDIVYPSYNLRVYEEVKKQGCIITEFPFGTRPYKWNFPRRNRIIAGISLGVIVIEAASRSGSLSTARIALSENRDVFAVPGNINRINSKGTNRLIQEGAKLVTSPEDVLIDYEHLLPKKSIEGKKVVLKPEQLQIVNAIMEGKDTFDKIALETEIPIGRLAYLLTIMQVDGIIKEGIGKRYTLLRTDIEGISE
ncbi:MAG: DNA-processing protein DprA [Thermotogae bacterium]|nr:DNA-processing protein DprA [Thermotogota bacterium]